MKSVARKAVASVLYWQVNRLRAKNQFQIIAVDGSVGKTSTKMAIANLLSTKLKVCYQAGNYNDLVTVPLIIFGQPLAHLFNPLSWLLIFVKNELQLWRKFPYQAVVLEIGTDGPGFMKDFAKRLKHVDINVLTGIAPEHMEYFDNLDAVAAEEKELTQIATLNLVNIDMADAKYLSDIPNMLGYALDQKADYQLSGLVFDESGCSFEVRAGGQTIFKSKHEAISEPLLYAVLAAIAVAQKMGLSPEDIEQGLSTIKPAPGRMQILAGVNDSKIIDDTYNASPEAVTAALKTLYRIKAPQKIAILGNMNELGNYSKQAHQTIGQQCDPKQVDLLVTIGPDAGQYLAAAAERNGCEVYRMTSPYAAGEFVKDRVKAGALVLAKGSQNGVFAEEAVKQILADQADIPKLVRQSKYWLKVKKRQFKNDHSSGELKAQ